MPFSIVFECANITPAVNPTLLANEYPNIAASIVIPICPKRTLKFVPSSLKITDGGGKRYPGTSSKKTAISQAPKITIENKIGIATVPDPFLIFWRVSNANRS